MKKIKVSADTVLSILKGVIDDEDINVVIDDPSAPEQWINKTVGEVLNIDYYTFKHRPMDIDEVANQIMQNGMPNKAFCILSILSTERVYSKDNDIVSVSANLRYLLQTDKIKILENLIEDISLATNGIRIPVQIGEESRQVLIAVGNLDISDIQDTSEFGEMVVCDLNVDLVFYPEVVSKSDYSVEFLITDEEEKQEWVKVPISSLSSSVSMTQRAIPKIGKPQKVTNINLSKVRTFVLSFDGYKNGFINFLTKFSLSNDEQDNNLLIPLRMTRDGEQFIYYCVVKDHIITIQEDTGNEVHSLTLTEGEENGTS